MNLPIDQHEDILKQLCRVCGQRAQTKKEKCHRPAKLLKSLDSTDLHHFYGIDANNYNAAQHPDKICMACYRRLNNFRSKRKNEVENHDNYLKMAMETDSLWKPHTTEYCATCMLFEFQKRGSSRKTFLDFPGRSGKVIFKGEVIIIGHVALAKQGDNVLGGVRPFVCPFVCALTAEPFDLQPSYSVCRLTLTLARLGL